MVTVLRSFRLEKETKGTWRYQEEEVPGEPTAIGVLYVRKGSFQTRPESLLVTIQSEE